jgi:hypothetical protein
MVVARAVLACKSSSSTAFGFAFFVPSIRKKTIVQVQFNQFNTQSKQEVSPN